MTRRAACTHSRLERSEPRGASSSPTRTCPPRAIAAGASFSTSTARPPTIHGAPGASLASSRKYASRAYSAGGKRSEEHTSELQSRSDLVCRLLLEKKKKIPPKPPPARKYNSARPDRARAARTDRHAAGERRRHRGTRRAQAANERVRQRSASHRTQTAP